MRSRLPSRDVPTEDREGRILAYLSQRAATPEHLEKHLGVSTEELNPLLEEMQAKWWVHPGIAAWFGDPSSAITVLSLAPAGREEAKRRQALSPESIEPVVVTREELIAELQRRGGSDEQAAVDPRLRAERFHFWPSIGAWSELPEEGLP